jgi:hypothetical protein
MSTTKDVAEHVSESISVLRQCIRDQALLPDTIGELRDLKEHCEDLVRLLDKVTDVDTDPDHLDSLDVYAMLDKAIHNRVGEDQLVYQLDEEGMDHKVPLVDDMMPSNEVGELLQNVAHLQSVNEATVLELDTYFAEPKPSQGTVKELLDLKINCHKVGENLALLGCFEQSIAPLDCIDIYALHGPCAMEEVYSKERCLQQEEGKRQGASSRITRFIRHCGTINNGGIQIKEQRPEKPDGKAGLEEEVPVTKAGSNGEASEDGRDSRGAGPRSEDSTDRQAESLGRNQAEVPPKQTGVMELIDDEQPHVSLLTSASAPVAATVSGEMKYGGGPGGAVSVGGSGSVSTGGVGSAEAAGDGTGEKEGRAAGAPEGDGAEGGEGTEEPFLLSFSFSLLISPLSLLPSLPPPPSSVPPSSKQTVLCTIHQRRRCCGACRC